MVRISRRVAALTLRRSAQHVKGGVGGDHRVAAMMTPLAWSIVARDAIVCWSCLSLPDAKAPGDHVWVYGPSPPSDTASAQVRAYE